MARSLLVAGLMALAISMNAHADVCDAGDLAGNESVFNTSRITYLNLLIKDQILHLNWNGQSTENAAMVAELNKLLAELPSESDARTESVTDITDRLNSVIERYFKIISVHKAHSTGSDLPYKAAELIKDNLSDFDHWLKSTEPCKSKLDAAKDENPAH